MRKSRILLPLLALSLLCACAAPAAGPTPAQEPSPTVSVPPKDTPPAAGHVLTCRVVEGAEDGNLLLAGENGEVYTLSTEQLGGEPPALTDGMMVEVRYSGVTLETYPARFADVSSVTAADGGRDDRCGLYLQVLEDLWAVDPGLNDGITHLGVDLSGLTVLSESEKSAVAYAFGMAHGMFPLEATWDELVEEGYIDRENLIWEDGVLFSIATDEDAVWSLPNLPVGAEPPVLTAFNAQKWRSGLGAYFFRDCIAQMSPDGDWSYSVGREAIS